jgi:hypothetical protein
MCEVAIGLKAKGERVTQRQVMLLGSNEMERGAVKGYYCPSRMGLARMPLQAGTECHRSHQGYQAEQGEDETTFGASSAMHIKTLTLLCNLVEHTSLAHTERWADLLPLRQEKEHAH